jgi:hypothetical protein
MFREFFIFDGSRRLEYEDAKHPDVDTVIERVRGVPIATVPRVTRRKSEIDSNRPKHDGNQEKSSPASMRKAAVWRVRKCSRSNERNTKRNIASILFKVSSESTSISL